MTSRAPFPNGYKRGRPHQWLEAEVLDLVQWSAVQITSLDGLLPITWAHIRDWTPSPLPATAPPGTRVSGGGRNDDGTKGRTYTLSSSSDPMARTMRALISNVVLIARALDDINDDLRRLQTAKPEDLSNVLALRLPAGIGPCSNPHCEHECRGGKDRLRAGRCATCAQYWRRNQTDRPHRLTEQDPDHHCRRCGDTATYPDQHER